VVVGVGVGLGVNDGVGDEVGVGHTPSAIVIVSMRHPGAPPVPSDPKRKRRWMVCPMRCGPRFTTVSM
jgi:hypothetical protein